MFKTVLLTFRFLSVLLSAMLIPLAVVSCVFWGIAYIYERVHDREKSVEAQDFALLYSILFLIGALGRE